MTLERPSVVSVLLMLCCLSAQRLQAQHNAPPADAQAENSGSTSQPATDGEKKPMALQSLVQKLPDYSGDIWSRKYLTGDWGGARTELANHGVLFEGRVTQYLQQNARGGRNTKGSLEYGGMVDYKLSLDTARMGLWPGGLMVVHGQTQFGRATNGNTGSLNPANFEMLFPVPGEPGITTLSEWYFMQALSEKAVILAGKVDPTSLADRNAFAGDATHTTQFLNTGLNVNPVIFSGGPYTTLMAGLVLIPTDWLQISNIVLQNNPDSTATTSGLTTAFSQGNQMTVGQEYDFTIKPFEQVGHQRFGWMYTNRDFRTFEVDSRVQVPGVIGFLRSVELDARTDNYCFYYNFDQYLFSEAADPTQGWGLFGRFGVAPSKGNPFTEFYSIGLGGKGSIPKRDNDTWGVGYYYTKVNDTLESVLGGNNEQGVEVFYNIEVTPWFHITPNLQIITDPAGGYYGSETALVYGIRGEITF